MKQLPPILLMLLACAASPASGEEGRHGFWGAVDIGFGRLHLAPEVENDTTATRLYVALAGGYTLHPQWQIGLEAGGWNIHSGNLWDPADGEGLSQLFAVVRFRPTPDSRLLLKVAGGKVSHWNNSAGSSDGSGNGYTAGIGYELGQFAGMETHWFLHYSAGSINSYVPPGGVRQSEDYRALSAGLSLGF